MAVAAALTLLAGTRTALDVRELVASDHLVAHTLTVSSTLADLLAAINAADTAAVGFLATGDVRTRQAYDAALMSDARAERLVEDLTALVADNPQQWARAGELAPAVRAHNDELKRLVQGRLAGTALALDPDTIGIARADAVRRIIAEMDAAEQILLQQRARHAAVRARITFVELAIAAILSFAALGSAFVVMRREIAERRRAEAGLASMNRELDAHVASRTAALEQANLRLDHQLLRLTSLRAIDTAILGSVDHRLSMRVVLEQAQARLAVDIVAAFLYDEVTLTLVPFDSLGSRGSLPLPVVRVGEGISGRAAAERRTVGLSPVDPRGFPGPLRAFIERDDVRALYATPLIARGELLGAFVVMFRHPFDPEPDWLTFLEALAGQAAMAIASGQAFESLQQANTDLRLAYDRTIEGWSRALDLRDHETEGHTQRVTELTLALARRAGVREADLVHVRYGALLHDIGKMGIPDAILHKPGPLTPDERAVIETHPDLARQMLAPIAYLRPALAIPCWHHERWDGSGYPEGLRGDEIPLAARLFAVADVWDALRSDRPYRPGWSDERIVEHIRTGAGSQFDPDAVRLFLELLQDRGLAVAG
jgi:putative nucleotidyltransferase with HDIG domain